MSAGVTVSALSFRASTLRDFTLKKKVALPALILAPISSSISLKMSASCTPAKAYTVLHDPDKSVTIDSSVLHTKGQTRPHGTAVGVELAH